MIEFIRLSKKARDHLVTLKRHTGIANWNVLCRWGFCLSIADLSKPRDLKIPADSSIEMTWKTFAGENDQVYLALLRDRCRLDGIDPTEEALGRYFRLHLHRGIAFLAGDPKVKSIAGLICKAVSAGSAVSK